MQPSESDPPWWKEFHVAEMADLFLERTDQVELDATLKFIIEEIQLSPGCRVYDQCCGIGSLSLALAERGFECVGVDLCEVYIDRALAMLAKTKCNCEFRCDDALTFVPDRPCQGVINWYSSFGYASTDSRSFDMARRAFEALEPNGVYLLDVPNFLGVVRGFQRYLVRTGTSDNREVTCIRESQLDLPNGLLRQVWNWIIPGKPTIQRRSALRIILPHQFVELLNGVGFREVKLFGGIDRTELQLDSPRLVVSARKPS